MTTENCSLATVHCYDMVHTAPEKASHTCMGLIIRSSAIHAAGCYSTTAIRKGERVAEYTGPRLTRAEADLAYKNAPVTYLFGLGDGSVVIDGQCTAMYISTTVATPTARPARKSPTITASMIAAPKTAKSCAAAARPLAAEPCTRRKKFAAVMLPPAGLQEIVGAHWQIVEFWASFCPIDQGFTLNAT